MGDTFEERIAAVRDSIASAALGRERDHLLIELGVLVAAQELTDPARGLAHAIMVSQQSATCLPGRETMMSLIGSNGKA